MFKPLSADNNKIIYLFVYIATALYLSLFYDYGINMWDEGIDPNGALRIMNGEMVSRDFLGYEPARYYLFAAAFSLFGKSLLVIRKIILLITALMPLLGYLISKDIMDKRFALFPFFLILSAPSVYYSRLYPFAALLNLYLIIESVKKDTKKSYIIAASSIIATLFFRIDIGVGSILLFFLGILLKKIYTKRLTLKLIGKACILSVIPLIILLSAVYIFIPERFSDILSYRFYHVFSIYSKWGNPFPPLSFSTVSFELLDNLLFYMPIIVYIISLWIGITNFIKGKEDSIYILLIAIFGCMIYTLVIWRSGFDNLLRVLPTFYILLIYLSYIMYKKGTKAQRGEGGGKYFLFPPRHLRAATPQEGNFLNFVPLCLLPLCLVTLLIYNFNVNHGFYAGSIGAIRDNKHIINIAGGAVYGGPFEARWIEEITSYVTNSTDKEDYIFAVPLNPIWYFLTERKNPTFYEWILPGSMQHPEKEEYAVVSNLMEKRPKFVILADIPIDGKEDRRFSNYAPVIYRYIMDNYHTVKVIDFFKVMRINHG